MLSRLFNSRPMTLSFALFLLFAVVLAACGEGFGASSTLQDLEGVRAETPHTLRAFYNIDQHPNIVVVCEQDAQGNVAGFRTITRDYDSVAELSPETARVFCNGEMNAEAPR